MADGVEVAASPASPLAVLGAGTLAAYWRFHNSVAKAQLAAWLPAPGRLIVDISGPSSGGAALAAASGHTVIRVLPVPHGLPVAAPSPAADQGAAGGFGQAPPGVPARALRVPALHDGRRIPRGGLRGPGRLRMVMAEPGSLAFLGDGCVDGIIADDGALSHQLMTEDLAAEIARVLRPGGELLACADSLVLGMAVLAEQRHWAHLVDLPRAEVVLIPWPDGTITRCFGAAQLRDLLTEAGLEVRWVRPRTVLSPSVVDHVLRKDPGAMGRLVKAELRAWQDGPARLGPEEPFGIRFLASARKKIR